LPDSSRPTEATTTSRILVVDDEPDACDLLKWALEPNYRVTTVTSATAAIEKVANEDFDVVLTDLGMGDMSGLELCERILGTKPDVPVIMVTGAGQLESAIAAMRAGAYDFITKPVDPQLLTHSVARAVQHRHLRAEVRRLRTAVATESPIANVIGESAAMRHVYELIARVAESDASVLIHGETGTGKELIARAIHSSSRRKSGPFVALNCAAVPPQLLESELFGHARGAFTDAKTQRAGLFLEASGGTLFLDEIGELPIEMQPKILRALQERTVRAVGSSTEVPFDVRIVTATNRDLEYEIFEKRFREDLFYRINVVKVDLPPLRARAGDVLHLAQYFLGKFTRSGKQSLTLSESAAEKLMAYNWPGNVRELENCMERGVALARFDHLTVEDLPEKIRAYRSDRLVISAGDESEVVPLDELERRYITRVLAIVGQNKTRAAAVLGLDRRTLYRRLERYSTDGAPISEAPTATVP
jgi:two-component system response regulator HydG